jgi:hypothetical protein
MGGAPGRADREYRIRAPGLRGLRTPLRHEPGDGTLGDIDTELQEFPVDARRTP